jgi:hypothetical protein
MAEIKRFETEEELFAYYEALDMRKSSEKIAEASGASADDGGKDKKVYPDDGLCPEAVKFVKKFISSGERSVKVELNSFMRRKIHKAAAFLIESEDAQITHDSYGSGPRRVLVLSRKQVKTIAPKTCLWMAIQEENRQLKEEIVKLKKELDFVNNKFNEV